MRFEYNSTDFKTHFGEFVELVRDGPIEVLGGGKPVGVFLSADEFAHLHRLDEAYREARTQAAEACGEEAMRLLVARLKRPE